MRQSKTSRNRTARCQRVRKRTAEKATSNSPGWSPWQRNFKARTAIWSHASSRSEWNWWPELLVCRSCNKAPPGKNSTSCRRIRNNSPALKKKSKATRIPAANRRSSQAQKRPAKLRTVVGSSGTARVGSSCFVQAFRSRQANGRQCLKDGTINWRAARM